MDSGMVQHIAILADRRDGPVSRQGFRLRATVTVALLHGEWHGVDAQVHARPHQATGSQVQAGAQIVHLLVMAHRWRDLRSRDGRLPQMYEGFREMA
jgi:hypothetical protein